MLTVPRASDSSVSSTLRRVRLATFLSNAPKPPKDPTPGFFGVFDESLEDEAILPPKTPKNPLRARAGRVVRGSAG